MNWTTKLFLRFVNPMDLQLEEFLDWKEEHLGSSKSDREFLTIFFEICPVRSVEDIDHAKVKTFIKYIQDTRSTYAMIMALKSVRCLLRYYKARKVDCMSPKQIANVGML